MNEITVWRGDFIHDTAFLHILNNLNIDTKDWDKIYVVKFKLSKDHIIELYDKDMEAIKQGDKNV